MNKIAEELQAEYDHMAKKIPVNVTMDPQYLQGFYDCLQFIKKHVNGGLIGEVKGNEGTD